MSVAIAACLESVEDGGYEGGKDAELLNMMLALDVVKSTCNRDKGAAVGTCDDDNDKDDV